MLFYSTLLRKMPPLLRPWLLSKSFIFDFLHLNMVCLGIIHWGLIFALFVGHLSGLVFSEIPESVVCCQLIITSNISSVSLSSLSDVPIMHLLHFVIVPWFLNTVLFFIPFSLCYLV